MDPEQKHLSAKELTVLTANPSSGFDQEQLSSSSEKQPRKIGRGFTCPIYIVYDAGAVDVRIEGDHHPKSPDSGNNLSSTHEQHDHTS